MILRFFSKHEHATTDCSGILFKTSIAPTEARATISCQARGNLHPIRAHHHLFVLTLKRTAKRAGRAAERLDNLERNDTSHLRMQDAAVRSDGYTSPRDMAEEHNALGSRTRRSERWHVSNVQNLLGRRRKVSTAGRKQQFARIVLF